MDSSLDSPRGGVGDRVSHFDYLLGKLTSVLGLGLERKKKSSRPPQNSIRYHRIGQGASAGPCSSKQVPFEADSMPGEEPE